MTQGNCLKFDQVFKLPNRLYRLNNNKKAGNVQFPVNLFA